MTTSPPTTASPTLPGTQLNLPLTNPENSPPISPQDVWAKLDPHQRDALFRQIVNICCRVVRDAQEVSDE
ncbi:MAG: hypothetical protein ABI977_26020 [Acidobacteriota bacterium]